MAIKTNIEGFKLICQAHYMDLYLWLSDQLSEYYGKGYVVADGDYIFCEGNIPVMLCAHVDTVHREQPLSFVYDEAAGTMTSPQGIGGDDRCGVYSVLRILKELGEGKKPFLFFSTDEEIGGASTKKAATDVKLRTRGIGYLIELDRQGSQDSVYYKCGNDQFKKWIDGYGFVEAQGTNTDICTLCKAWDLAGVNFSIGYMKNHTVSEIVTFSHMEDTIEKVLKIIADTKPDIIYPFCEVKNYPVHSTYPGIKKFIVGDIVEPRWDCIAYKYAASKDSVESYTSLMACTELKVITLGTNETFVECKSGKYWVDNESLRFVRGGKY